LVALRWQSERAAHDAVSECTLSALTDSDSFEAEQRALRPARAGFAGLQSRYGLWRAVWLRSLGLIYVVAFWILIRQHAALFGAHGLLPAPLFLKRVAVSLGSANAGFWRLPTIFWLSPSDAVMSASAVLGFVLACALLLGFANAASLFLLWGLYLSFVHVGQIFYGYGWESLLCETGFLAIFLAAPLDPRALPARSRTPEPVVVLLRWLTFRVMFGAGLIKLRGDACWTELTCLDFHYETQPNPGPLSPWFHHLPSWVHHTGVLFNHFVELVVPFAVFGPRPLRRAAGLLIILFQLVLIASGNLSFLNWLTMVVALACFDDGDFRGLFGARSRERAASLEQHRPSRARLVCIWALVVVTGCLSVEPALNLLSPRQAMNAAFDPFDLVNTYGAFGSVSRERYEVIIEGTAATSVDENTVWQAYELPCKPGRLDRGPCLVTPYHYRLDWQLWFVPLAPERNRRWFLSLAHKLLRGDTRVLALFAENPFPGRPPRFLRATFYRYRFAPLGSHDAWQRSPAGQYLPPVSLADFEAGPVD